jgi:hypothetical protein
MIQAIKMQLPIMLLLISNVSKAQDGVFWGFHITFQLENRNIDSTIQMDSISAVDFYVNEFSVNNNCAATVIKNPFFESVYDLGYTCSGMGGASATKKIKCPDIYMEIVILHAVPNSEIKYIHKLVPFILNSGKGPFLAIKIKKINLQQLITHNEPFAVVVDGEGNYKIESLHTMKMKPTFYNLVVCKKASTIYEQYELDFPKRYMD